MDKHSLEWECLPMLQNSHLPSLFPCTKISCRLSTATPVYIHIEARTKTKRRTHRHSHTHTHRHSDLSMQTHSPEQSGCSL